MIDIAQSTASNLPVPSNDNSTAQTQAKPAEFTGALKGQMLLADASTPASTQATKAHVESFLTTISEGKYSTLEQVAKLPEGPEKSSLISRLNQEAEIVSGGAIKDVMKQAPKAEEPNVNPMVTALVYGAVGQVPTTIANYQVFRNWGQVAGAVPDSFTRDVALGWANYSGALSLDESKIPNWIDPKLANTLYSNGIASAVASFTTGGYGALSPKLKYPASIRAGIVALPPVVGMSIYGLDKAKEHNVFGLYKPERNENGNLTSWKDWAMENVTTGVTAGTMVGTTFGGITYAQHLGKIPVVIGFDRPPVQGPALPPIKNLPMHQKIGAILNRHGVQNVKKAPGLLADIFIRGGKKGDIPIAIPKRPTVAAALKALIVPTLTVTGHVAATKFFTDAPEGFWPSVKQKLNTETASIGEASLALTGNMIDMGFLAPMDSYDHGLTTNFSEMVATIKYLAGLGPEPEINPHRMLPEKAKERYANEVIPMARQAIHAIINGTPQNENEKIIQTLWAGLSAGGNGLLTALELISMDGLQAAESWNNMTRSGTVALNNIYSVVVGMANELLPEELQLPGELKLTNNMTIDLAALKKFIEEAEEDEDKIPGADPSAVASNSGPGGTATSPTTNDAGSLESIFKNPFTIQNGALQTGQVTQGATIFSTGDMPTADLSMVSPAAASPAPSSTVVASNSTPAYQSAMSALPGLEQISYQQFSQLSPADQSAFVDRAVAYSGLSPAATANTSLYEYVNSDLTSEQQRMQMSSVSSTDTVHQSSLASAAARSAGHDAGIAQIKSNIEAIQANTKLIEQQTAAIQNSNAASMAALSKPTSSNPVVAAFVDAPAPASTPAESAAPKPVAESALDSATAIPRFMVIRTESGARLVENLPNGQTQMLPFLIPANTPATRQTGDGWVNVPDAYAIAGANMLDIMKLYAGVKMLNGGAPVKGPADATQGTPVFQTPQLQPAVRPSF